MTRLCAPSLVEWLLIVLPVCKPLPTQRRLQFRNEIKVPRTEIREVRRVLHDIPPPQLQKFLDTSCSVLHYHGGLLYRLEELDVSSSMYDADCTAEMNCSTRHRQCGPHEQDETPEYRLVYAKTSMSFVGDGFCRNLCLHANHDNAIHLVASLVPVHTLVPRFHQ